MDYLVDKSFFSCWLWLYFWNKASTREKKSRWFFLTDLCAFCLNWLSHAYFFLFSMVFELKINLFSHSYHILITFWMKFSWQLHEVSVVRRVTTTNKCGLNSKLFQSSNEQRVRNSTHKQRVDIGSICVGMDPATVKHHLTKQKIHGGNGREFGRQNKKMSFDTGFNLAQNSPFTSCQLF